MTLLNAFLFFCFLSITASLVYWSLRLGITPTPTSPSVRKVLALLLPKQVKGEIHELGSGWGNLLPLIKTHYPDQNIQAHERSPVPRFFSKLINNLKKKPVAITSQDIFSVDLSKAGLVICYLYPAAMDRLSEHLKMQLPENCWVISHTFRLPGWMPVKTIQANDLYKTPIYLYRKNFS